MNFFKLYYKFYKFKPTDLDIEHDYQGISIAGRFKLSEETMKNHPEYKNFNEIILTTYEFDQYLLPHFHITNENKTINCRVSLFKNKFIKSNEFNKYFDKDVAIELNNYLKTLDMFGKDTEYSSVIVRWMSCNRYNLISKLIFLFKRKLKQPDYSKLERI